jgi:hypothetical protein
MQVRAPEYLIRHPIAYSGETILKEQGCLERQAGMSLQE